MGDEFNLDSLNAGESVYDISNFLGGDSGIDFRSLDAGPEAFNLSGIEGIDLAGLLNFNNGVDLAGLDLGPEAFNLSGIEGVDLSNLLALNSGGFDMGPEAFDVSPYQKGYFDEITGKFIHDPLGGLTGELTNETSGTNADSMKDYTYDKATGTWTTPTGEVYKPDTAPSNKVKTGAQVMVDAGALPRGYAGLAPTKGSTADIKGGKDGVVGKTGPAGIGGKAGAADKKDSNSGMLMALLALMAMMNKGSSGGSSPSSVIPSLAADRKQLPYGAASGSKARPGAGGVTYFSPTTYTQRAAGGGMMGGGISDLGGYSDGGRLLRGPGDGVSDSIPATIGGKQPARLAEGEFVVPARIVSELGNGSTEAGAKKLYAMMDRVQKARRKTKNVAADTKAQKYLPA